MGSVLAQNLTSAYSKSSNEKNVSTFQEKISPTHKPIYPPKNPQLLPQGQVGLTTFLVVSFQIRTEIRFVSTPKYCTSTVWGTAPL